MLFTGTYAPLLKAAVSVVVGLLLQLKTGLFISVKSSKLLQDSPHHIPASAATANQNEATNRARRNIFFLILSNAT
jgi:hypothetical protein